MISIEDERNWSSIMLCNNLFDVVTHQFHTRTKKEQELYEIESHPTWNDLLIFAKAANDLPYEMGVAFTNFENGNHTYAVSGKKLRLYPLRGLSIWATQIFNHIRPKTRGHITGVFSILIQRAMFC